MSTAYAYLVLPDAIKIIRNSLASDICHLLGMLIDGLHPKAVGHKRIAKSVDAWSAWREFLDRD